MTNITDRQVMAAEKEFFSWGMDVNFILGQASEYIIYRGDETSREIIKKHSDPHVCSCDLTIMRLRAAIEAADAAAWRPIEKAPKDGTPIMMAQQPDGKQTLYPRYCVAAYQTIPGGGALLLDWQYGGQPTHFRYFSPLPEPPKEPR